MTNNDFCLQANVGKCVRIYLTVCLVCQTIVDPPKDREITRDDITCKITYCSVGEYFAIDFFVILFDKYLMNIIFHVFS